MFNIPLESSARRTGGRIVLRVVAEKPAARARLRRPSISDTDRRRLYRRTRTMTCITAGALSTVRFFACQRLQQTLTSQFLSLLSSFNLSQTCPLPYARQKITFFIRSSRIVFYRTIGLIACSGHQRSQTGFCEFQKAQSKEKIPKKKIITSMFVHSTDRYAVPLFLFY